MSSKIDHLPPTAAEFPAGYGLDLRRSAAWRFARSFGHAWRFARGYARRARLSDEAAASGPVEPPWRQVEEVNPAPHRR